MKSKSYYTIFLILTIFSSAAAKTKSDLQEMNLKGNVKSVQLTTYKAVINGDKIYKGKRKNESKDDLDYFILFNDKGNKTDKYLFNADSSLERKLIYQYDSNGSTTQEDRFDSKGTLTHSTIFTYTYDNNGKVMERIRTADRKSSKYTCKYDEKGNIIEWDKDNNTESLYKYDDKGNVIEIIYNKEDGSPDWKYTYTYDSNGNKNEETWYQSGSKFVIKYLWKYDIKNNVVECIWVDSKGKSRSDEKWSYTYEYDTQGNWIKQIEYMKDKPILVTERKLEYF